MYSVKEMFYTLQGEGRYAGRPAVFLRFAGCNLWSGREQDRAGAQCQFCDTAFIGTDGEGGGRFSSAAALAAAAFVHWPETGSIQARPFIVCTGGEPLLQLDAAAVSALQAVGFEVAVETNGTLEAPAGIDWLCVSPKAGAPMRQRSGNELKVVFPQAGLEPMDFADLPFDSFRLSPMDTQFLPALTAAEKLERSKKNIQACVEYCQRNPQWQLSMQLHKVLGIP